MRVVAGDTGCDHGRDRLPCATRGVDYAGAHVGNACTRTHFVFDKTGTLTHGRYELLDVKVVTGPEWRQ